MKITPSLTALLGPGRPEPAELLGRLRPGQELHARVLDVPAPGLARLQIGLTQLLARTPISLAPGTALRLSVGRLHPLPELKVLQDPPAARPADALLRSALPRQVPISDALAFLRSVLAEHPEEIPPEARRLAADVAEHLREPQRLEASGLRERFLSSGLFLEAALAAGDSAVQHDLKGALLQLLRQLRPDRDPERRRGEASAAGDDGAPPGPQPQSPPMQRLFALIQGALARIQSHQAASLPEGGEKLPVWQFELPLLVAGEPQAVLIRIEGEEPGEAAKSGPPPEARWSVAVRIDLVALGPIQARITVTGERVSGLLWCERSATHSRVAAALPTLAQALCRAGLEVDRLQAVHGVPPAPLGLPTPPLGLLNIRA